MARARRQGGFTYVGLLIAVAVFGLVTAASLHRGVMLERRVAEQELIVRGQRLVRALDSYAAATPPGRPSRPASMQDLLRDPRFPDRIVRHLRRIEPDPMTGAADWAVVFAADGSGIEGFHSQSAAPVLGRVHPPRLAAFDDAVSYRDWVFRQEDGR